MSVVSRATGSDQLWASGAVRELCLYLFPATDCYVMSACITLSAIYYVSLSQVMPAVVKKCLAGIPLFQVCYLAMINVHSISDSKRQRGKLQPS